MHHNSLENLPTPQQGKFCCIVMQARNSLENFQTGIRGKFCYSQIAFLFPPYGDVFLLDNGMILPDLCRNHVVTMQLTCSYCVVIMQVSVSPIVLYINKINVFYVVMQVNVLFISFSFIVRSFFHFFHSFILSFSILFVPLHSINVR